MDFSGISDFFDGVIDFLPTSPFVKFLEKMQDLPYLSYLNYFLPISQMIAIGEAWLVAIGVFYLYQIVLRWIKAIE